MRVGLCLAIALLGSACGDDGGSGTPPDASPVDAAGDDAASVTCTHNGFTSTTELAERDDELGVLFYTARAGAAPNIELLTYDLYFPLGATDAVHEYTFTGENLADCHTCLQMRRDCTGASCISGQKFLVQEGSVSLTQVGAAGTQMQGTFSNLKLAEVTIGSGLTTTLVPNGETWCIDSYSFDATITTP
jgi:hypothetical protein